MDKSGPKSPDEIRAALQGGIARSSAAPARDLGGGERLLAATFRAEQTARALQKELSGAGVLTQVRKVRRPLARFEVRIDAGDREQAMPLVDAFRSTHQDPPPIGHNHRDLLILSTLTACALGLAISANLGFPGAVPVLFAMTGAGALLGFMADYVVARAKRNRLRFGIYEMMMLITIVGVLLMIARQLPKWLKLA